MNNNRLLIFAFSFAFLSIVVALFLYLDKREPYIRETLSFFPIDNSVEFETGSTSIRILPLENGKEFSLEWTTYSKLTRNTLLRHDFSLLFEDGKLKDKMGQFEENNKSVSMGKKIMEQKSGHYEAVTFHHAEFYYPNDKIKSKQLITSDELYITNTQGTHSFKVATTQAEDQGKQVIDNRVQQNLNDVWHELIKHYQVNKDDYTIIPLTNIDEWNDTNIPNFTAEQSAKIKAAVIENIYNYYFSGIPKGDRTYISLIGSYVPIILIPKKEKNHLMILFRTEDGKNVQLIKTLSL